MLSDFENHPTQQHEIDATKATASLPGLNVEIVHRRSSDNNAEQLSINLQAVPSFEEFGRFVENANPFALWACAIQMAWLPWLAATQAVLPTSLNLPRMSSQTKWRPADDQS